MPVSYFHHLTAPFAWSTSNDLQGDHGVPERVHHNIMASLQRAHHPHLALTTFRMPAGLAAAVVDNLDLDPNDSPPGRTPAVHVQVSVHHHECWVRRARPVHT